MAPSISRAGTDTAGLEINVRDGVIVLPVASVEVLIGGVVIIRVDVVVIIVEVAIVEVGVAIV